MRKAAISIMPACLVVALGGLSVTPSVAQVAEPPARLELPEGHARGQPGRADGPRRPARSARAAHHAQR